MKNKDIRGFTLGELLIVVAIIAVLVAIAIPIFNKQIEKAREAYDIYTMRQAASAAIELYYAGVKDSDSADKAGLKWWPGSGSDRAKDNAAGAYDPKSGTFYKKRQDLPVKTYGKGTTIDGGTTFVMGNPNGAYKADQDYRKAVVMVAIYPNATPARVDVFWKNNVDGEDTSYVGGQASGGNAPKYSISILLN